MAGVQSADLQQQLGQLRCIPTTNGSLAAPKGLFDARNRQLAEAMGAAASMPAEPFTSNEARLLLAEVCCVLDAVINRSCRCC